MKCILISDINNKPMCGGELALLLPKDMQLHLLSLANLVGKPDLSGMELHDHLIHQGGMTRAVQQLLKQHQTTDIAIGYSAGGTVLWRACLAGLNCTDLFCLSSTRLRNESNKPTARTHIFFDQGDITISSQEKLLQLSDHFYLIGHDGHTAYLNPNSKMSQLARRHVHEAIAENPSKPSCIRII
ncbi:hypothetical protein [uncultured Deefgea sp.]|uniref:hypothetical protein n=1 Tax=uncultured Deefgea sp. TaxID=1304914 RepID=UPI0026316323|nr:hypothetical protein [uncultured Deefgea sp.]